MDLKLIRLGKIDFACEVAERAGTGVTLSGEDLRLVLDLIIERNMQLTTMTAERDALRTELAELRAQGVK